MSIKRRMKHIVSFLLHGEKPPIYAKISYLQPNNRLKDRRIIVTGGSRGLGHSMAKKFIEEGANVLVAGRNLESLRIAAAKLGCKYLVLDVQDTSSFKRFIEQASILLEGVNCLVSNAGISLHEHSFFDVTENTFDSQINTNFKGNVFLIQEFVKYSIQNGVSSNIIVTSSEVGELADNRPYGWTKASLNSMVRGLASNFAETGIRINAISPGITCSDMTGVKADGDLTINTNATKRAYLPEEIAEVAAFLLSDCSNCISGQVIVCNNGKTIYTREKVERHG